MHDLQHFNSLLGTKHSNTDTTDNHAKSYYSFQVNPIEAVSQCMHVSPQLNDHTW